MEMQGLLAVAMRDQLVEKLSYALHDALFTGEPRVRPAASPTSRPFGASPTSRPFGPILAAFDR